MGKLTGAAMILVGCMGLVAGWLRAQRARQRTASELIRILAAWEYSLEREKFRLIEFLERCETSEAPVERLRTELIGAIFARSYTSGAALWADVLGKNRAALNLGEPMWEILLAADGAFFGTSSRESLRCTAACRRRMEECLERERQEFGRRSKVCLPVGMLGGTLLIIWLI